MLLRVYVERRVEGDRGCDRFGGGPGLRSAFLAVAGLASVLGCGSGSERPFPDSSIVSHSLAASLIVQVRAEDVRLVLQVSNATGSPILVTFPTQQRFDFAVTRDGERLWAWSEDQVFAQAVTEDTLAPAETWRFEARWVGVPPEEEATYAVEARLASSSHPVRAAAEFQLP